MVKQTKIDSQSSECKVSSASKPIKKDSATSKKSDLFSVSDKHVDDVSNNGNNQISSS
jgi:hypothetical protein